MIRTLSKTALISAWQCPKKLYLEKYHQKRGLTLFLSGCLRADSIHCFFDLGNVRFTPNVDEKEKVSGPF